MNIGDNVNDVQQASKRRQMIQCVSIVVGYSVKSNEKQINCASTYKYTIITVSFKETFSENYNNKKASGAH